jgi:hypothetical protein
MKKIYELTVAICVYNTKYLNRLLLSLEKQTYKNVIYLFIIDNPIQSKEIINIIKKFKFHFKIYKNIKNLGEYKSYDISLKKSNTKFFLRVDDDDYFLNVNYLNILMNIIRKGYDFVIPNVHVVYSNKITLKNQNLVFKNCVNKEDFIKAYFKESSMVFYSLFNRKKLSLLHKQYFRKDLVAFGEGILNLRVCSNLIGNYSSRAIYCYFRHNNHSTDKIKNHLIYLSYIKFLFNEILNLISIDQIGFITKSKKISFNIFLIFLNLLKIAKNKIIKT